MPLAQLDSAVLDIFGEVAAVARCDLFSGLAIRADGFMGRVEIEEPACDLRFSRVLLDLDDDCQRVAC